MKDKLSGCTGRPAHVAPCVRMMGIRSSHWGQDLVRLRHVLCHVPHHRLACLYMALHHGDQFHLLWALYLLPTCRKLLPPAPAASAAASSATETTAITETRPPSETRITCPWKSVCRHRWGVSGCRIVGSCCRSNRPQSRSRWGYRDGAVAHPPASHRALSNWTSSIKTRHFYTS